MNRKGLEIGLPVNESTSASASLPGIRLRRDDATGVAQVTLNRPDQANALTAATYDELHRIFRALQAEPTVRAVVIAGAGRHFCVGNDPDEMAALTRRDLRELLEHTQRACNLTLAIRSCDMPVIAALQGRVAGAGMALALAADLRVAGASARICCDFVPSGCSGAEMGVAWLLPRIVGLGRASELLLTGATIDAAETHRIGLCNRVVADGDELQAALALATKLAAAPMFALGMTRRALEEEAHMELSEALAAEARTQAVCMLNPDFRSGQENDPADAGDPAGKDEQIHQRGSEEE